jgi:hypothetical protein
MELFSIQNSTYYLKEACIFLQIIPYVIFYFLTMAEPYASPGCSDLSIDLLIRIVRLVELPEAVAFRSRSVSAARHASMHDALPLTRPPRLAVPTRCTPWLDHVLGDV